MSELIKPPSKSSPIARRRVHGPDGQASATTFVPIEQAAEATGITPNRLRSMVLRGLVPYRGGQKDPLFSLAEVERLRQIPMGILPAKLPVTPSANGHRPSISFEFNRVIRGNVLDVTTDMPDECVQAVVTSPPFWGQRVYADETAVKWKDGREEPFGREPLPEQYVAHTLEILAALARVLRTDGTIWWNLGDTYMTRTIARTSSHDRVEHYAGKRTKWAGNPYRRFSGRHPFLKDKDLTLIPFHVAVGAQHLGFWVRSAIVWSKQGRSATDDHAESTNRAHVPEVVGDRPVVGHEYVLLLAKSEKYAYYPKQAGVTANGDQTRINVRTVWTFPPVNGNSAHGARFPGELPRRCILLGTRRDNVVFDPFAGEGTTLIVARELRRRYFGCEISSTYVAQARRRLSQLELKLGRSQA